MEDRKFCPLCYCLADTAQLPRTLMCEKGEVYVVARWRLYLQHGGKISWFAC